MISVITKVFGATKASVDAATPQMAHNIVKSKGFQLAANNLLGKLMRSLGITTKVAI